MMRRLFIVSITACLIFQCNSGEKGDPSISSPPEQEEFVYFQYSSGCALHSTEITHDTTPLPDIVVSAKVLSVAESSEEVLDSLVDGWVTETMIKRFVYRAEVDEWIVGMRDLKQFSVTTQSGLTNTFRGPVFVEATEDGDSLFRMEVRNDPGKGYNSTNLKIPRGTRCIFHFSDSAMTDIRHIASYTKTGLSDYLSRARLDRTARP